MNYPQLACAYVAGQEKVKVIIIIIIRRTAAAAAVILIAAAALLVFIPPFVLLLLPEIANRPGHFDRFTHVLLMRQATFVANAKPILHGHLTLRRILTWEYQLADGVFVAMSRAYATV